MSGRKPKPTHLKEILGNPGHRPLNEFEPSPEIGCECPSELVGAAREEWYRTAPQLEAIGILSEIDAKSLAAYCVAWARWVDAEDNLRRYGSVIKTPKGYPIQNPYLGIANTAMDQMRKFAAEFGMTPSSRSRLSVGGPRSTKSDPADKYLNVTNGPGNSLRQ